MSEVKMQIELFVNVQVNFIFFLHSENVANIIYIYIYIIPKSLAGAMQWGRVTVGMEAVDALPSCQSENPNM